MREYIPELMPRIVEALLDGAAATKREVAVATLGQVVQSTGYVDCFNLNKNTFCNTYYVHQTVIHDDILHYSHAFVSSLLP